jgi:hypothetical protein
MGNGCIDPRILDIGTSLKRVVSFTPRPLYARGNIQPRTHWIGGWVSPRAGLDTGKRKSLALAENRTPTIQARSPSLYLLSYLVQQRSTLNERKCGYSAALAFRPIKRARLRNKSAVLQDTQYNCKTYVTCLKLIWDC